MTIYIFIILAVCVLDQLTKLLAMNAVAAANSVGLEVLGEGMTKPILDGVLNFTYIKNDGMAFGWLDDHRWVFMLLSAVGIAAMFAYLLYLRGNGKLFCFSLSLVIGGGVGNMFDRVLLGYVVDFIDVKLFGFWKWVFNLADCAVCVGAALLILSVLVDYKKEKQK